MPKGRFEISPRRGILFAKRLRSKGDPTLTVDVRMDEVARHTGPLPQEFGNFVGGRWTTPDGEALSAVSPASGGVIATVPAATRQDVAVACQQAAGAAEAFGALTALERSSLCHRVADFASQTRARASQLVEPRRAVDEGFRPGGPAGGLDCERSMMQCETRCRWIMTSARAPAAKFEPALQRPLDAAGL